MSDVEQAVVEEDDVDTTLSTEDTDAQDKSIDELLSEFDDDGPQSGSDSVKTEGKAKKVELDADAKKEILEELRREQKTEEEITGIVSQIKGDLLVEDEYVRWKLETMATKDKRMWNAFVNRNSKPKEWNAIVEKMSKDLNKTYGSQKKTDKEAIVSAVRGANETSKTTNSVDVKKLSQHEFQMQREKLLEQAMKG